MTSGHAPDFRSLFETAPGLYLVLLPDLTIIAVSNTYLHATMTQRESILEHGLFEIFPDNPEDDKADGVLNLRASLNYVLEYKEPHTMGVQKYDIRRPDGVFEARYWSPLNTPVLNDQNEIIYIIHNVTDVTKRYTAEAKLKRSEKDYQLLVNSVKDYAIFMLDANGMVASWNSGAEIIKGYTAEEIIGWPIDVFYTAEQIRAGEPKTNLQLTSQNGHHETEGCRVRKDGSTFWANIVFTALRDEEGVLYGYSKITRDITQRKKAEDELALLSLQINQSSEAIYVMDADLKIKRWNKGAERLYGYSKEEMYGKDPNKILQTHLTVEQLNALVKEIEEQDHIQDEVKRKAKNGNEIWVYISTTTLRDDKKNITGYISVNINVTGAKKLREQIDHLATIVDQSSEAIISRGIDNRFISWNRGAERLFGYSKEEAIGKTPNDLRFTGYTEQEIAGIGQQIIEKGSWNSEREFFHKNGSSFFGTVNANAVRNEQGEITSMVFIIKDISLRKQLEEQLKKYNTELEREVKERTEEVSKSEKRFRSLIENNNDVITLMDRSFKLIYRSPAAIRVTGWTNEDMINVDGTKNIHPDDMEEARAIVSEVMANPGKRYNTLFRNLHKDGHYIWMEGILTNWLHDEKVQAVVFNYHDVTERITTEEKMAASEMRFRLLIENSTDGIDLSDEFSNNIYRSPGAIKITGMLPKENQMGFTHPDDVETIENIHEELIKKPGIPIPFQARFRHALGHYLWLEGTLTNMLHVNGVNGFVTNFRDITQRKEMEFLLHKANTLARIGGWEVDLIKGAVYWSDITREIHETGYDYVPELATGLNFYKEGKGRNLITRKVMEAVELGKPWDVELQIITAKNNERWIRTIGETEFADGKCVRIYGSFQDIDQRKKAEEKLIESEKRFRALVENNYDIITLIDESFKVIYHSPSVSRVMGFNQKEMEALEGGENVHPDDRENAQQVMQQAITSPGKPINAIFRILHKDGHYVWLEGVITNLLHDEYIKAFVTNFKDVTEQLTAKEKLVSSEKRFRALIENNYDIISLMDKSFRVIYRSPSAQRITGWSDADIENEDGTKNIHPDDLEYAKLIVHEVMNNPRRSVKTLFRNQHKDGRYLWMEGTVINMLHDESINAIVFNFRDVTERIEAEEKIKNLNADLEEKILVRTHQLRKSNEELEAFSYSVSHDLRAPLRAVIGYTTILEEDYGSKLDEEAKRITTVIKNNTVKMGNLIDDLLAFSRMGRHELLKTTIDTNQLVTEIKTGIDKIEPAKKDIRWVIHPLPCIQADINTIRQVWINLLSNAVKYSAKVAAPVIEVGSFNQNGQTVFFIKDNGAGFNEKYKNKLFKVFQRLHGAQEFEGTGIGLAIVEKIISKHGGHVWAEGEVNKGANFYFTLPDK